MARYSRLIIYEAENDEMLARQLANSLSEGIHSRGKITITIINLQDGLVVNGFVNKTVKNLDAIDFNMEV